MNSDRQKKLRGIKTGALSRGLALARMSISVGSRAAAHSVGKFLQSEGTAAERFKSLLQDQAQTLARELGQLKGSVMKVGQMLSVYGDHFLPPEALTALKSLQSDSPPLEWKEVEKQLRRQLGPEKLARLEIDPEPLAAASLGQVHRARIKNDPSAPELALKIQYPGVDTAIDSDLKALRTALGFSRLLPSGPDLDPLFDEVRTMLRREVDYVRELAALERFRERLGGDPRYIVPRAFPEFSSKRVLATSLELGQRVDGPEVAALSEERRNALAHAAMSLYIRELFEFQEVQTDPHVGNYRVRLGTGGAPDQWVLFDFGAVREIPSGFLRSYRKLIRGSWQTDEALLRRGALELGLLEEGDDPELVALFMDLCRLLTEPFRLEAGRVYDFAQSDLPKRIAGLAAKIVWGFRLRTPPQEFVFLDRKLGGMFALLAVLKARFNGSDILERHLVEVDSPGGSG